MDRRALMEYVIEWAQRVGDNLDDLPPQERREMLQLLLERVMIDRNNKVIMTLSIPTDDLARIHRRTRMDGVRTAEGGG